MNSSHLNADDLIYSKKKDIATGRSQGMRDERG